MSSIVVHDLARNTDIDHNTMSTVRGGLGDVSVNVPIFVSQNLSQIQSTNVLNNSFIGADLGTIAVAPLQGGFNSLMLGMQH